MGAVFSDKEEYVVAIKEFEVAAVIWQRLGRKVHLGRTLINLGDVNARLDRANNYYQQAIDILEDEASPSARELYREAQEKLNADIQL